MYTEETVQKILKILGSDDRETEIREVLEVEKPKEFQEVLKEVTNFEEWKVLYFKQLKMDTEMEKQMFDRGLELVDTTDASLFLHGCTFCSSSILKEQVLERAFEFAKTAEDYGNILPKLTAGSASATTCILKMAELIEDPQDEAQDSQESLFFKFKTG